MTKSEYRRVNAIIALVVMVLAVASFFVLKNFAVGTVRGQRLDEHAMDTVAANASSLQHLHSYLGIITITSTGLGLLACVLMALARRRLVAALGAVTIVVGANISTQLLKRVLVDRPDFGYGTLNAFPSGHTTVATSAVLAAILVAPAWLRHYILIAGSFAATLVGASTIVGRWHRPSEVIAALLVSLAWGCLVAAIAGTKSTPQVDGFGLSVVLSLVGAAVAGILLVVIGVRPSNGFAGLAHATEVLGVVGIATALTISVYARLVPR